MISRIDRLSAAVLLVVASLAPAARATDALPEPVRYGPWVSSRIGGGGYVQRVAIAPTDPKRVYTYVDMAGAYRSDDGGQSWRMIHADLPTTNGGYDVRGVSVDPRDADHVFFCVGNHRENAYGIFESRDGGATYALVERAIFSGNGGVHRAAGQVIDRSPTDPDVMVAGEYDGVRRSDDGGKTWRAIGLAGHQITDLRFDRTDGNRIYACTQAYKGQLQRKQVDLPEAFFRSDDGGQTWQKLADESPAEIVQSDGEPGRLFGLFGLREVRESTDHGATWRPRSEGLKTGTDGRGFTSPFRYRALASGPDFVLVGNGAGDVFRLDKGATTWRPIVGVIHNSDWWSRKAARDGDFGHAMGNLTVDPNDPRHWIMTDWYAVWHTFDAGANWSLGIAGYEPTYVFHLFADAARPDVVHMTMSDNGYFRSTDGGRSFQRDVKGITSQIRDVDASPAAPDRLYAVGSAPNTEGGWHVNQLFISDDDGSSWTTAPMTGLPTFGTKRFCASVSVDPQSAKVVYLGVSGPMAPGDGGPYRSADGGLTWQWIGKGLPAGEPFFRETFWGRGREIQTLGGGQVLAGGEKSKTLYRWDESAGEWSATKTFAGTLSSIAPDPTTPGRVLVSAEKDGLWLSADAGRTFGQCYKGDVGQAAWDPRHAGRAIAGTSDWRDGRQSGVLMTTDAGTSWQWLDQSLPMRGTVRPAFVNGQPIVGTSGSGVFRYEP